MKHLLAFFFGVLLFFGPANAELTINQLNGFDVTGAPAVPATLSAQTCNVLTTDLTTYTYTAAAIGTAGATRKIIVGMMGIDSAADFTTLTLTVGGSSATKVVEQSNGAGQPAGTAALWIVDFPTGTTANIVVTWSEAVTSSTACVWAAYDVSSSTAVDTNLDSETTNPLTLDLDIPTDGFAVGVCEENFTDAFAWTGMTELADAIAENAGASQRMRISAAQSTTPGLATAVTCDSGSSGVNGVTASFR